MKRVLSLLLMSCLIGYTFIGCGKSEEQKQFEEMGFSEEDAAQLAEIANELSSDDSDAEIEATEESEPAIDYSSYKLYDKSSEWEGITPEQRAIQIDDVFLLPGMTMGEVADRLAASEVDYEYEFNPDELLAKDTTINIVVKRDGQNWFNAWGVYANENTGAAKDATLIYVQQNHFDKATEAYEVKNDKAFWYTRIIDGTSVQDILSMSMDETRSFYSIYSNFTNEKSDSIKYVYEDETEERINVIKIYTTLNSDIPYTTPDGQDRTMTYNASYCYMFNSTNGEMVAVSVEPALSYFY